MAKVIVARSGPLIVFQRGSDGTAKILAGNDTANSARFAGMAASSAVISEEWASGTEPGGPGTRSSKEEAERAQAAADAIRATNILFDSFNEYTAGNPTLGNWSWYDTGVPSFTTSSSNIALTTPVALRASGSIFRKVWKTSNLGLKEGDTLTVSALAWFTTAAGGRVSLYIRAPGTSGTNLATSVPSMSGVAGLQNVSATITIPSGHGRLIVQVESSNAAGSNPFEVGGVFAFNGQRAPAAVKGEPDLDFVLSYLNAAGLDSRFNGKANANDLAAITRASTNLFDNTRSDLITTGKYVNSGTGNLSDNASYNAYRYIPVAASTNYTFSRSAQIAWYDSSFAYISGDDVSGDNLTKTVASPSTAAYLGVSYKPAWASDFRVNQGSSVLPYETGARKLDATPIMPIVRANDAIVGRQYLKRARIAIRSRLRGTAGKVSIAMHMDSWGSASNINYALAYHNLRVFNGGGFTAVGLSGPGWIGLAYNGASVKSNTLGAGSLYSVARTGTWTNNFGTDAYSPDVCSASTTDTTATYTITSTNTANIPSLMTLLVGGSGSFDYSWNGSSWTTVTLTDANRQAVVLAGIPTTAAWTLRLRCPSASAFKVMGLLADSADSGVVVHSINATGTYMFQRAGTDPTAFAANAALINPDIVFIGTPINDRNIFHTPAKWKADVITLINLWRTWRKAVDICIIMPPEVGGANTTSPGMAEYTAAAIDLVDAYRVAVLNMQPLCGAVFADYQNSHPDNALLDSLNTHMGQATTSAGSLLYQDALMAVLTNE